MDLELGRLEIEVELVQQQLEVEWQLELEQSRFFCICHPIYPIHILVSHL